MRVIAGTARSLPLKSPKGDNTRPTIDKHKETLFNCLNNYIYDCIFVDLFSGSGAIAIEALSRGAKKAYLVERNKEALKCIKENLSFTHLDSKASVVSGDVMAFLRGQAKEKADIIFLDPPFKESIYKDIIEEIVKSDVCCQSTKIIVESTLEENFDYIDGLNLEIYKVKEYKTCKHTFMQFRSS